MIWSLLGFGCSKRPQEVMVPMRDGVKLHTMIWKPAAEGSYPVVLTRGYWPGRLAAPGFTKAGYVYVGQSTRGHGESEGPEGVRTRFFDDPEDGYDTLTWISQQPWCNGQIAMYGRSYWAATQWAVATEKHPNLKAIIPQNVGESFKHGYWSHGALTLAMTARGRAYGREDFEKIDRIGWLNYFRHLPLITLDEVVGGADDPGAAELWKDYIRHSTNDEYWQAKGMRIGGPDGKYRETTIPVYLMGGWYDYYPGSAFNGYQRLRELGATDEIRITVNPSDHLNRVVGDREFGSDAHKDEIAIAVRWLDHVLKGVDNGIQNEPPVRIFVMGANKWRNEHEWPLARTKFTKYYFRNPDGTRVGRLETSPPGDEPPTKYTYDPNDPVPTLGGNHSFCDLNIPDIIRAGAVDQRPNESRDDVLVFSTDPLTEDTEVTGPVSINLYAASTARDTDFTAKLIDVHPDGTAYNLTEGILRARFRESVFKPPKLLEPGKIYEYHLELLPTSNVFKKGHRIRVHLTSSNFPLWDRNPNTGNPQGLDAEVRPADQTVHHDSKYPSHILLPIIPKR